VIHPSIHPKENVRQLFLCTKSVMSIEENRLTYGEHIGMPKYDEGNYKAVYVVDDGRMLVLLDHLSEYRFFLVS
jgi:hypothetical protein